MTNVDLCPLPNPEKLKKTTSKQISIPARNHLKGVEGSHKKKKKKIRTEVATVAQKLFMKNYFKALNGENREEKPKRLENKDFSVDSNFENKVVGQILPNQTLTKR